MLKISQHQYSSRCKKIFFFIKFSKNEIDDSPWGFGFFINTSPIIWKTFTEKSHGSTEYDSLSHTQSVTPLTIELYATYLFAEEEDQKNPLRIAIDGGFVFRISDTKDFSELEKKIYLKTNQSTFPGLFAGFNFHFSGTRAYIYGNLISKGGNSPVKGLTGFNLIASIGLSATIADLGKK
jgi:hypothetical protein